MIDAGTPLDEIFDEVNPLTNGLTIVKMDDTYNVINNDRLMLTKWLTHMGDFHDGLAQVQLNDKWNFIDTEGKLRSNQWLDYVGDFSDGFARVKLNGKENFIDKNGKLLSEQWFDNAYKFSNGLAKVTLSGKTMFIDSNGKLTSRRQ